MSDPPTDREVPLLPVLSVSFIGTLGYSVILPFLVFLVTRLGGNALVYGMLGATYPLLQLVGAPLLGRWSDRWGRRRVLLLSQAGTALSWAVFAVALVLPVTEVGRFEAGHGPGFVLTLPVLVLFAARALDGLTGGNVSVANAYLADVTPEERRTVSFGKMAVATNLGFVVGPALAGLLGATAMGESLPVLAALALSVVGLWLVARLPEPDPCLADPGPRRPRPSRVLGHEPRDCVKAPGEARWRDVWRLDGVPFLLALYFLVFLGFNFFYTAFPLHAAGELGWSIAGTGTFFAVLSALMVVVQGPVLARVSKHVSEARLVPGGAAILGASFLVIQRPESAWIYAAAALFALGNGLMWPSFLALLSKAAGERHQGSVQGLAGACGSLASVLGLLAGGVLYEAVGAATFAVSAVTIFAVALSALRLAAPGAAGGRSG